MNLTNCQRKLGNQQRIIDKLNGVVNRLSEEVVELKKEIRKIKGNYELKTFDYNDADGFKSIKARQCIENYYKVDMSVANRKQDVVLARSIYYYWLRRNTKYSFQKIGNIFAHHYSTVMHGINNIDDWLRFDKKVGVDYALICRLIEKELNNEQKEPNSDTATA